MNRPRILYCHCNYAQIIAPAVKESVLKSLCDSGQPFEAVADLCEMSARKDPVLQQLAQGGPLKIAACYPRAVKWLFTAAQAPLNPDCAEVVNMRVQTGPEVVQALSEELKPNLRAAK